MSEEANIFDLENQDDLPFKIKPVKGYRENSIAYNILKLFDIKDTLKLPEIRVGLYRKYKMDASNKNIGVRLSALIRAKRLERLSKGLYSLVKE